MGAICSEAGSPLQLALGVTMRREEVLGLRWSDVDLEGGQLTVSNALTYADRKLHQGEPKSAAGVRTIVLPGFVLEALRRHRAAQNERRLALGAACVDTGLVVDRRDGAEWSPPPFSKGWQRFATRAGFEGVTFHTLRHGAATLMKAAGIDDAVTIKVMGHADARVLRRYADIVPQLQRDAADRMHALLGAAAERQL